MKTEMKYHLVEEKNFFIPSGPLFFFSQFFLDATTVLASSIPAFICSLTLTNVMLELPLAEWLRGQRPSQKLASLLRTWV